MSEVSPSFPGGMPSPATVFGTTPDHPDTRTKIRRVEPAMNVADFTAVSNLDPFQRGMGQDFQAKLDFIFSGLNNIFHHHFPDLNWKEQTCEFQGKKVKDWGHLRPCEQGGPSALMTVNWKTRRECSR